MSVMNIKDFPEDIHREAKIAAVKEGRSLKAWLIEAMKEKLERDKGKK